MTDAANAVIEGKEADHHPYFRPKDAATLILIDRSGDKPKVLVGKRHDKVVFMPGKYVFPGGRVDKTDNRVPVAAPISGELEANLLKGSPKIAPSRARALAVAAGATTTARPRGRRLARRPVGVRRAAAHRGRPSRPRPLTAVPERCHWSNCCKVGPVCST